MFLEWERDIKALMTTDYFTKLGSYVLDSSTMWQEAAMNSLLAAARIPGKPPRFTHDYLPHRYMVRNWIKKLLELPCDVYITGHVELHKSQAGDIKYTFMTTGQGVILIPILFDEVYVMRVKEGGTAPSYSIQTCPSDMYDARSRLAEKSKLEMYEKPDMKHILKKAGYSIEDKPPLFK